MAAGKKLDWKAIKTEYITTNISQRELAKKRGVSMSTLRRNAQKQGWYEAKKKYQSRVVQKAVQKIETKESNLLARELSVADKITGVLEKTFKDANQFQRHIVQTKEKKNDSETVWEAKELVFNKIDMQALKQAADTLQVIEKVKRSILHILTETERIQLEMAREKLELEKQKLGEELNHTECGVVELAPILPEEGRKNGA